MPTHYSIVKEALESFLYEPRVADRKQEALTALDALKAELDEARLACNICETQWPNHADVCAYVGNVRRAERVALMLNVMKTGFKARPDEILSADERNARDAMRSVIGLIEEALSGW